jgi:hypothetical protein
MNLTVPAPLLTSAFWCSRRSAGDGIVFGVLAAGGDDDAANCPFRRRPAVAANPSAAGHSHRAEPAPCAVSGIAFLWFIGVGRDQLGEVQDRLFSTVSG